MEVQSQRPRWKTYLTWAATTFASVLLPFVLWLADRQSKGIEVEVISRTALNTQLPGTVPITVSLGGKEIAQPFHSVLELRNTGSQPITKSDFEAPPEITAGKALVVRGVVTSASPVALAPKLYIADQRLFIEPLLLNPGDKMRISVVTSNAPPSYEVRSRIAGVRELTVFDDIDAKVQRRAWMTAVASLSLIAIYGSLLLCFVEYRRREMRRWPLVFGGVACAVAAFLLIDPWGRHSAETGVLARVVVGSLVAIPVMAGSWLMTRRRPLPTREERTTMSRSRKIKQNND